VILSHGRTVAGGKVSEIKERLAEKRKLFMKLASERDDIAKQLLEIDGVSEVNILSHLAGVITLEAALTSEQAIPDILAKLVNSHVSILSAVPKELSLEEIFEQVV
jgi:ABC-type uncharacterized transport system ATPase subunit